MNFDCSDRSIFRRMGSLTGTVGLNCLPKSLLQNVCIGRLDPFVVMLFGLHDFESEFFVKVYCAFIVYLDVSTNYTLPKIIIIQIA